MILLHQKGFWNLGKWNLLIKQILYWFYYIFIIPDFQDLFLCYLSLVTIFRPSLRCIFLVLHCLNSFIWACVDFPFLLMLFSAAVRLSWTSLFMTLKNLMFFFFFLNYIGSEGKLALVNFFFPGWKDISGSKVLAWQAWTPNFRSQIPFRKNCVQ